MHIDRRITNGLAWAGAALVVAIPTVDFIARQFAADAAPQVAIVQAEPEAAAPELPTPVAERPAAPAATPEKPAETNAPALVTAEAEKTTSGSGDDAVDAYLQSGRALPSYISDGGTAPRPAPAAPSPTPAPPAEKPPAVEKPPAQSATPQPQVTRPVIETKPARVTGFPTPVSERPASVARPAVPPVVVNPAVPVVTAEDLADWETGPLSDFLARRQGQRADPEPRGSDSNGFWLDEGPNGGDRRFPPAYGDDYYYPFGQ